MTYGGGRVCTLPDTDDEITYPSVLSSSCSLLMSLWESIVGKAVNTRNHACYSEEHDF